MYKIFYMCFWQENILKKRCSFRIFHLEGRLWRKAGIDKAVEEEINKCLPCKMCNSNPLPQPLQMSPLPDGPWTEISIHAWSWSARTASEQHDARARIGERALKQPGRYGESGAGWSERTLVSWNRPCVTLQIAQQIRNLHAALLRLGRQGLALAIRAPSRYRYMAARAP